MQALAGVDSGALTDLQRFVASGMENAAQSLSEMTGQEVTITTPELAVVELNEVAEFIGGPDVDAAGVYLHMEGDLNGHMLLVFPMTAARTVVDFMLEQPVGTTQAFDALALSALSELGNVTLANFLNALAALTATRLQPSPPHAAIDMAGSLIDGVLAVASLETGAVISFRTRFMIAREHLEGVMLVLPDVPSMARLASLAAS